MKKLMTLRLRPGREGDLITLAAKELGLPKKEILRLRVLKKSVDARDRDNVKLVYSLEINGPESSAPLYAPEKKRLGEPPVIVGCGPAGLFCAYVLALAGSPPILLERGGDMSYRTSAVENFEKSGILDPECNIQFGEGGAGTFSDGKLGTGVGGPLISFILHTLAENGAPEEILWTANPHAGTDRLRQAVRRMRGRLEEMGCRVEFGAKVTDISVKNGKLAGIGSTAGDFSCETAVFAIGHSARDTFEMLHSRGVEMEQKMFSAGVRIEHLQKDMDRANYGKFAGHPSLPASAYKLNCRIGDRGVYTFCVCPGGVVVGAASEPGGVVTNGMSFFARNGENINGALLVNVGPGDFGKHPLGGMYFQRELEQAAFRLGGGGFFAPCQTVGDFLKKGGDIGPVTPTYKPGVRQAPLEDLFPEFITAGLKEGLAAFGRKISGYDSPHAAMTGVETRSSSPVRIVRGPGMCSTVEGLYPCGEGGGWAGGIVSAAIDGIKIAEAILRDRT